MVAAVKTLVNAPSKLRSLQGLRGVAAVAVILSHAARHVDKAFGAPKLITLFQSGHAGVDLFFTLSGFIILFVHRRDVGRQSRLTHYLGRRFTRVMPLYWLALAITIAMSMAGTHSAPSPATLIWSVLLLPSFSEPLLGVAWTLQFELVFYAIFSTLILSRKIGIAVMTMWLLCITVSAAGFLEHVPSALCGTFCLEFFMGMLSAEFVSSRKIRRPIATAVCGVLIFITMLILESAGLVDGFAGWARLVYGPSAALLITGLVSAEQTGKIRVPAFLEKLGSASYSIYLFQFVFIGFSWQAWLRFGHIHNNAVCFGVLSASALVGGIIMSELVERPLLALFRGWRTPAKGFASY